MELNASTVLSSYNIQHDINQSPYNMKSIANLYDGLGLVVEPTELSFINDDVSFTIFKRYDQEDNSIYYKIIVTPLNDVGLYICAEMHNRDLLTGHDTTHYTRMEVLMFLYSFQQALTPVLT